MKKNGVVSQIIEMIDGSYKDKSHLIIMETIVRNANNIDMILY